MSDDYGQGWKITIEQARITAPTRLTLTVAGADAVPHTAPPAGKGLAPDRSTDRVSERTFTVIVESMMIVAALVLLARAV